MKVYELLHSVLKIILLKSRQTGESSLSGLDGLLKCALIENFTVLILSITGDDSEEFMERSWQLYRSDTQVMKDLEKISPVKKKYTEEVKFVNGSRFICLPANGGSGKSADQVIIDEFFKINKTRAKISIDEVMGNVEPTTDKRRGQIVCLGTAEGQGKQKQMYFEAKQGLNGYTPMFFSCFDDPMMTMEKRAEKVRNLGVDLANQEYPRTDVEAFLASGRPRFNVNVIREHYEPLSKKYPVLLRGFMVKDINGKDKIDVAENGDIRLYAKKEPRQQYFISADIAEGLQKGDWDHAAVYELPGMMPAATVHCKKEPTIFGHYLAALGRYYNNAVLCPERNNHGIATIGSLRGVEKYPDALIHVSKPKSREHLQDDFNDPEARWGFQTTRITRPVIIDNLGFEIERKIIPVIPAEYFDELYAFVRKDNGDVEAEEGCFDDRVMELAIARYVAGYHMKRLPDNAFCVTCSYMRRHGLFMRCRRSGRFCKEEEVCRLWREIIPDIGMPSGLNQGMKFHTV
jgi:hypothetical protein